MGMGVDCGDGDLVVYKRFNMHSEHSAGCE